jgi:glycosyltransferase involved in cell wall biosynthesis
MANSLDECGYSVSAILMRRLLPRRLYPGRNRVGALLTKLRYSDTIQVVDGVDYYWMLSILRAVRHLWRDRPDVVVFEWWTATVGHTYLLLAIFARVIGAKVVVEFHETLDTAEAGMFIPGLYARAVLRPFLALTQAFAVHSTYSRHEIDERYALGRKPIVVVPHGPYDHFVPTDGATTTSDDSFHLLYFGTIRPYKGLEYLIDAFEGLTDAEFERFRLTVVGETWEGWTLPGEMIARSQHRERITFVNRYVTEAEAQNFFSAADAIVLPYIRSSASGPMHIAMSFGLPIVVTTVGGLPETADRYRGAILVPPKDADALREAIRTVGAGNGVRFEDPFDWMESAQQLASLFDGRQPSQVHR